MRLSRSPTKPSQISTSNLVALCPKVYRGTTLHTYLDASKIYPAQISRDRRKLVRKASKRHPLSVCCVDMIYVAFVARCAVPLARSEKISVPPSRLPYTVAHWWRCPAAPATRQNYIRYTALHIHAACGGRGAFGGVAARRARAGDSIFVWAKGLLT